MRGGETGAIGRYNLSLLYLGARGILVAEYGHALLVADKVVKLGWYLYGLAYLIIWGEGLLDPGAWWRRLFRREH